METTIIAPKEHPASDWRDRMRRELTMIIPAYRCGRYLRAAVDSVLYTPVGNILIAEDGSGDDTLAAAYDCEKRHPGRIRVLAGKSTRGPGSNVNRAVQAVETAYFAKLDGDDVLIPGFLEAAFRLIAGNPEIAVISGRDLRIEADEVLDFIPERLPKAPGDRPARVMSGTDAYRFIVHWDPNPCSSGAAYRTEAFRAVGGFDEEIIWGEDWEIWLRFAQSWAVAYCDELSALYRQHPGSVTATETRRNRICYGYDAVFRRAAKLCPDPELKPLLRICFLRLAKSYCGAALRQFRSPSGDSLVYFRQAMRALSSGLSA